MKPLGKRHNQRALYRLAEQGIELTPDDLIATRKAAYATIRREMQAKGYEVPDDDAELFLLIKASQDRSRP
jgi:hypothetical protein